jgi:hypothetical protein
VSGNTQVPPAVLLPAENLALTVARAQLERGENPPVNTTAALVAALDRLTRLGRPEGCGQCDGGLISIGECNCGSPADSSIGFAHERLCGYEPCPNGCWEKLHPSPETER